ncbi:MarR family winged helix-turn-helix transcriptional regulator [Bacillus sp. SG-1]|uniref:MarR family winged helix-turn-helix transcriptional regulator n=1 Tax=Bacillus sp. SG-1 TaxID=161544 RepID=UPI0005C71848|nr:MarR family transcriptional regulator [Bacillus sp. SG-1]
MFRLEELFRNVFRMMKHDITKLYGQYLSSGELLVLKYLSEHGEMKASDLSKKMEVSASHVTSVTDSLTEKGYITRQRSSVDRRVVELTLTEKGKEILDKCMRIKSEYFQEKFNTFSNDEIEQLIYLFTKLEKTK